MKVKERDREVEGTVPEMEERVKRVEFISDILNFLDVCPCWKGVQDEFLSHLPLTS